MKLFDVQGTARDENGRFCFQADVAAETSIEAEQILRSDSEFRTLRIESITEKSEENGSCVISWSKQYLN